MDKPINVFDTTSLIKATALGDIQDVLLVEDITLTAVELDIAAASTGDNLCPFIKMKLFKGHYPKLPDGTVQVPSSERGIDIIDGTVGKHGHEISWIGELKLRGQWTLNSRFYKVSVNCICDTHIIGETL